MTKIIKAFANTFTFLVGIGFFTCNPAWVTAQPTVIIQDYVNTNHYPGSGSLGTWPTAFDLMLKM